MEKILSCELSRMRLLRKIGPFTISAANHLENKHSGTELLCSLVVSCSTITHLFRSLPTLFMYLRCYYCVSCAWKYSDRTEAVWCQSFNKFHFTSLGEIPPPLLTCLPFILKQDRTREYDGLKEGRPRERWMANVLVEHNLCLKPHEIFPENTHIWLLFNSTLKGGQVFWKV